MRKFNVVYMRGGTSKGCIFHKEDLPENRAEWDDIFVQVMGSPDPKQIDGMGGTVSSNNKIVIVWKSDEPNVDIEYLVGQSIVGKSQIDYKSNCGNMTAAVPAYAVEEGMVDITEPITVVRMLNKNTDKYINVSVPIDPETHTFAQDGDCHIAGIDGTAAELKVNFLNPAGAKTGKLLPTGYVTDTFEIGGKQIVYSLVVCLVLFVLFGGHKVKAKKDMEIMAVTEKFTSNQLKALGAIVLMLVLIIFGKVNIGLAALSCAAILLFFRVADDASCIKAMPWNTILMVLFVGALLRVVDKMGGISLMRDALASIMSPSTAASLTGFSAGLLSLVSSALSVVYPTMMPICVDLANQIGGTHPVALMSAVAEGGALAGTSPMSTGGALILAALGGELKKEFTKEYQNKVFAQLLLVSGINLVVLLICAFIFYGPIAQLICPM